MMECKDCEFYDPDDDRCTAFVCDGLDCPKLPCEQEEEEQGKIPTLFFDCKKNKKI